MSTVPLEEIAVGSILQIAGSEVPYIHIGRCRLTNVITGETNQFSPPTPVRHFASHFAFDQKGYWADWKPIARE